ARHVEHVPLATAAEPGPELRRAAELVVADDPAVREAPAASLDQLGGDPPARAELDVLGDVAAGPAGRVPGPVLGQVQLPVQRRRPAPGGVGPGEPPPAVLPLAPPGPPPAGPPAGDGTPLPGRR